jgi:hypothetical protein
MKPTDFAPCKCWLDEGRIIQCEWITDDGKSWVCAHCGRKPRLKIVRGK